jgi:hypothetical protein
MAAFARTKAGKRLFDPQQSTFAERREEHSGQQDRPDSAVSSVPGALALLEWRNVSVDLSLDQLWVSGSTDKGRRCAGGRSCWGLGAVTLTVE